MDVRAERGPHTVPVDRPSGVLAYTFIHDKYVPYDKCTLSDIITLRSTDRECNRNSSTVGYPQWLKGLYHFRFIPYVRKALTLPYIHAGRIGYVHIYTIRCTYMYIRVHGHYM
jgi:hypothetical protein